MAGFFIGLVNLLIIALGGVLSLVFSILPPSPFHLIDNSIIGEYLSGLNWIVPVDSILALGSAWLSCIAIYFIYQAVMRWIKLIK